MAFQISGKLAQILPPTSGLTKTGNKWVRQEFIVEQDETGKMFCFSTWNQELTIRVGTKVFVSFEIETREYNGKYYTNLSLVAMSEVGTGTQVVKEPQPTAVQSAPSTLDTPPSHSFTQSNDSDLPF